MDSYIDGWEGTLIGATDAAYEGNFIWDATREPLTYKNWIPGQPDNYYGAENCAHMTFGYNGQWNDLMCDAKDSKQMSMCEKLLPAEQRETFLKTLFAQHENVTRMGLYRLEGEFHQFQKSLLHFH